MSDPQMHKGLVGVIADTTSISKVNPETNSLLYRGYPVQELAAQCSFEEVAYLLWNGVLPTEEQATAMEVEGRAQRALTDSVRQAIDLVPLTAHPMDTLRTAVSVIGATDPRAADTEADYAKSIRLLSQIPTVIAYDQRRRRGQQLIEPRDDLSFVENFLFMTFDEEPDPVVADALRVALILYAEHSFNASTFTARVITSTMADLYSAVVGAIGALKGPLHGGANEEVMEMLGQIVDPNLAEEWLTSALADKRKIMGFGHRVYKRGDSRVPTMKAALDKLVAHTGERDLAAVYDALEAAMLRSKNIYPNLDYASGPAFHLMGFDTATFTPLFVAARIVGWTAHIMEQAGDNALIRPLSEYVGPAERHL